MVYHKGMTDDLKNKPLSYWEEKLTPEQFRITRLKGTEAPFSGEYDQTFDKGMYVCVNCGKEVFASDEKYDAGCGWPSFTKPIGKENIVEEDDNSLGMRRTEVICSNCHAHLGHVFPDGPTDKGGQRYCINSAALKFHSKDTK